MTEELLPCPKCHCHPAHLRCYDGDDTTEARISCGICHIEMRAATLFGAFSLWNTRASAQQGRMLGDRERIAELLAAWDHDTENGDWPIDKVRQGLAAVRDEHSGDCTGQPWTCARCHAENVYRRADAILASPGDDVVVVPRVPTEAQWGGLARAIMMWLDMTPKTPRALFKHLKCTGEEIPDWLRDEPEMQNLDHVPSKGTRCVLIYTAMIAAASTPLADGGAS